MNQLEVFTREKTPETILKDKRGFKIVHLMVCDAGATTITNDTRNIRLNPMSFPFNGPCRIYLTSVYLSSSISPGINDDFVNLSLNISQPYAQSNMPYVSTALLSKNNSTIWTFNPANLTTGNFVHEDLKSMYIDANLSPNSIIELNLVNESGSGVNFINADSRMLLHIYIKARPYH